MSFFKVWNVSPITLLIWVEPLMSFIKKIIKSNEANSCIKKNRGMIKNIKYEQEVNFEGFNLDA
jgi:hypothetical protein